MPTLYGIANCDSVRQARAWLGAHGIDYRFHDFRRDGVDAALLRSWASELGWERLINRRGTTWRQLPTAERAAVNDAESALRLLLERPALLRRPLLDTGTIRHLGFTPEAYAELCG
jgi:arsenate reductase (glutaredoxin)